MTDPLFDNNLDWMMTDENGDPIKDPQAIIALQKDVIRFGMLFARYVKENDRELWKRAGDFAADYTSSDTIRFVRSDENTNGTE